MRKILDFLGRDFEEESVKRSSLTMWKNIRTDVVKYVEELREEKFSKAELEALKACYETEYSDNSQSITDILAIPAIVIGVLEVIKEVSECFLNNYFFGQSTIQTILPGILNIVEVLGITLPVFREIKKISDRNVRFRNRIMAVNILLAELEDEK